MKLCVICMRNNDKIIYIGKDLTIKLPHVQDGVRCHLEQRTGMDPAERQCNGQVVFIIPLYFKLEGIDWIHPQIAKSPSNINQC